MHVPLQTTHDRIGVFSLLLSGHSVLDVGQRELLETVADHVAALVDRYNLIRQSNKVSIAEESEKLYRALFDCISHELKTPLAILTATMGQINEFLKKGNIDEAIAMLDEGAIALSRLRRIVDNLLGMTRMESDRSKLESIWCDLEEIVDAARLQVADLVGRNRMLISIPDDIPSIKVDPILITHAISNLLANAAQYSPAGSEIAVLASVDDKDVVLEIRDRGEGIPAEELGGRLFEKFHRGRNARPGGIGLGLSIVHRFMELIGGTVTAGNNEDGVGAVFTLRFPYKGFNPGTDHE
jgi:two-component system sensor histidine kinase KdpD